MLCSRVFCWMSPPVSEAAASSVLRPLLSPRQHSLLSSPPLPESPRHEVSSKQASRVSCTYGVSTCCICSASYYSIYSASSRSICSTSSYSVRNASYYGIHDSASLSFHDTSLLHVDGSSHVRSRSNLSSPPLLHAPLLHSQATAKTVFRLDHIAEAVSGQSPRRRKLSEERR